MTLTKLAWLSLSLRPRYLEVSVILKRYALLLVVFILCQTFPFVFAQSPAQVPAAPPGEHRKTSEPYTGDLSIFDSAGRDKRLQINRVMDIL